MMHVVAKCKVYVDGFEINMGKKVCFPEITGHLVVIFFPFFQQFKLVVPLRGVINFSLS